MPEKAKKYFIQSGTMALIAVSAMFSVVGAYLTYASMGLVKANAVGDIIRSSA